MTMFTPPDQLIERDRYGRPMVYPTPDAKKPVPYTRCTTFVSTLEDTWNLNRWQQRMVALGLSERPDLLLSISNARDDKAKLNRICEDAAEAAKAHAKATIGTALHGLTEKLDRGEDVGTVPPDYTADLTAYQAATAQLTVVEIERFMVLDLWKVGGTPDRIVEVNGKRRILDLKTGSIEWGIAKIAQQLAVYSRSMLYDPTTRERSYTHVEADWGIIAHLPAGEGRCELYRVDLEKGWHGVQLAKRVRDWRARKFDEFAASLDDPPVSPVLELIDTAETVDALTRIWMNYESVWQDDFTQAAAAKKALLQGQVA